MSASVDILLATYNGARHLPAQLASIEAQSHRNWRLIVRDDGSDDDSVGIVRAWAARMDRPVIICEDGERRVGPAQSFGRLLERSEAPFFAFCDQDDVWHHDKLKILLDAIRSVGETVALAHSDLAVVNEDLKPIEQSFWRQQATNENLRHGAPSDRSPLFVQNPVTGCAMLGNAGLREAMLPIPRGVAMHDWWAALTAAFRGKIVPVDSALVHYRQHAHNSVGARDRTLGMMLRTLVSDPTAGIERTWKIFDMLELQAGAALENFSAHMHPNERKFAQRLSNIGLGLRRKGGWPLLLWSLGARRRLSLVAHLISRTFSISDRQKGNQLR